MTRFFEDANEDHKRGNYKEAVSNYDDFLKNLNVEDWHKPARRMQIAIALYNKSDCLEQLGKLQERSDVLDKIIHEFLDDTNPVVEKVVVMTLVNKGVYLSNSGHSGEAGIIFAKVIAKYRRSTDADLRKQVAIALYNQANDLADNNLDSAVAGFDEVARMRAEATNPAFDEVYAKAMVNKGSYLFSAGRFVESLKPLSEVIAEFLTEISSSLRSQVAMAMVKKAASLGELGKHQEAFEQLDTFKAKFASDTNEDILYWFAISEYNRAALHANVGQVREALLTIQEIVQAHQNTKDSNILEVLGMAKSLVQQLTPSRRLGHFLSKAEKFYKEGNRYFDNKQYQEARRSYEKALELNKHDARYYYSLGNSCRELKDYLNAIESFDNAIRLGPESAEVYYNRGKVYYRMQEHEKAAEDFQKVIRLTPKDIDAYIMLGILWYERGDYSKSVEYYDKALEIDPGNRMAIYNRTVAVSCQRG